MQSTLDRVSGYEDLTAGDASQIEFTKHIDSKRQTLFLVENVDVQLSESNAESMEILSKMAQVSKNVDKAKDVATKLQSEKRAAECSNLFVWSVSNQTWACPNATIAV